MTEKDMTAIVEEKMGLIRELRFFDSSIWLGQPEGFPLAEQLDSDSLSQVLDRRFISGGLISHWSGKSISAPQGNEAVLRGVRGQDKELGAIWTGLPLFPDRARQCSARNGCSSAICSSKSWAVPPVSASSCHTRLVAEVTEEGVSHGASE